MGSTGKPARPDLPEPGAAPRIGNSGAKEREKPILHEQGDDWSVDITPLTGSGGSVGVGASLGGGRHRPRATFEIRAEYVGTGLPPWSIPNTTRIELFHTEDVELAQAVAAAAADRLRAGERDILLNVFAEQLR